MKLIPFGSRVIVRRKAEDRIGGIIVPGKVKERCKEGEVLEAGPHCIWVSKGDRVLWAQFSGYILEVTGYNGCIMMNEEDLVSKIVEEMPDGR